MKNKQCHHEWEVVNPKDYNLKERTSLARFNPNLVLVENKRTKERKWIYKQMLKGGDK